MWTKLNVFILISPTIYRSKEARTVRNPRRARTTLLSLMIILALAGCSLLNPQTELLRSDMPLLGLDTSVSYKLVSDPGGTSETNEITLAGMGDTSPMPLIKTTFTKSSDTVRQQVSQVFPENKPNNALGMTQAKIGFGLTNWLEVSASTHELRDKLGGRACGAKVRMNFKPNGEQFIKGDLGKGWDAIWYYTVPCTADDTSGTINLASAKFHALVITEQWVPRITGKPLMFNRGRSVTIVGGEPAQYPGGWWLSNVKKGSDKSVLGAAALVRSMVQDLNSSPQPWLSFNPTGQFQSSKLIYSAGDADVFWSVQRVFLNRQTDYVVNYRDKPSSPWKRLIIHPVYNFEWNDWAQNWEAFKDFNPLNVDDKLNEHGIPKDPNDPVLKEIEQNGWQNAANATLEQIQLIDGVSGRPLYAMTVRGYIGAKNSLVMFGKLPDEGSLAQQHSAAETRRQDIGYTECPVFYDDEGNLKPDGEQWSPENCAEMLREGAMWSYLTQNPDSFGFDLVSQFNVRDNGTWASRCSGSGESTSCVLVPLERKLDAVYMFNQRDTMKPWTIMQVLGEVGVRTLGMSYASDAYAGTGMMFAMGQSVVLQQYNEGITDPEMVFALDARALQLPNTLKRADDYLK